MGKTPRYGIAPVKPRKRGRARIKKLDTKIAAQEGLIEVAKEEAAE